MTWSRIGTGLYIVLLLFGMFGPRQFAWTWVLYGLFLAIVLAEIIAPHIEKHHDRLHQEDRLRLARLEEWVAEFDHDDDEEEEDVISP